ncbi:MAG TPA: serine/threonine-protein kinase [Trebonia sp.]|jgi:tRNA A-37 threonylcarbamoyl transferase component Bud32|nr:serine/threonine-protein kinase [Trebonia sp.]
MEGRLVAGRYQLIGPLGRGAMGAVWLCADPLTGRQVAVKELRPPAGSSEAEQDVFRRRALAEARSAARLSHPNAVTLYDVIPASPADDAVYLIMEYVDGATLAQVIEREGPLSEPRAADIALQMLSILDAAGALGIVHRDIKPTNIMITAAGQVKLADFGIAHMVGGTRLTGSGVIGTPAYMAPEQLQGLDITPAVDLWALGATLFDAVAGRNPFVRQTTAATFHAILMADVPAAPCGPPLALVIAGLLARDPAQRMSTRQARALLTGPAVPSAASPTRPVQAWAPAPHAPVATGATGPTGPTGQTGPTGPPPGHPNSRRRAVLVGGGGVVVVAAAAIAVTLLHESGKTGTVTTGALAGASKSALTGTKATPSNSAPAGSAPAGSAPTRSAPASSAPASGSAASAVPAAYLGQWRGTITENNGLQGPQTADLKLTGGSVNAVVGTSSYTSGGCTYNLRLVSSSATQVELHEEVTGGACESDYAIVAVKDGKLIENVYVLSTEDPPDFTGTLAKI